MPKGSFYKLILFLLSFIFIWGLPAQANEDSVCKQVLEVDCAAGKRVVNLVCADMQDKSIRIESVLAKNELGQKDYLQNIALGLQSPATGTEVIAAINGGYFEPYTQGKTPLWSTIEEQGEFVHLGDVGSVIGFAGDNQVQVDNLYVLVKGSLNGKWDEPYGWYAWGFNHVYGKDNPDAIAIFTPAYGKTTGPHDRYSIIVKNGKVAAIKKGNAVIPADGYTIVMKKGAMLSRFKTGSQVDYRLEFHRTDFTDGIKPGAELKWDHIRTTVGAGPTLIKDGKIVANGASEGFWENDLTKNQVALRSCIGVTADNVLIMGTVPLVSMAELAEIAQKLNLVQAINLDGGLSSALYCDHQYLTGPYRQVTDAIVITRLKEPPVRIKLGDREMFLKSDPIIKDERVLVPMEQVLPAMQINASFDRKNSTITAQKGNLVLKLKLDKDTAQVNGKNISIYAAAAFYNKQVYVPIRLIAEVFNLQADWDPAANMVILQ